MKNLFNEAYNESEFGGGEKKRTEGRKKGREGKFLALHKT